MHIAARAGFYEVIDLLLKTGSVDMTIEDLGGVILIVSKLLFQLQRGTEKPLFSADLV